MSKLEPRTYTLKNGQTLLLREAAPDDAPKVLAFLNRVGGESDNLLFGENGFPMPLEREQAFLELQQKAEKSIMLAGFVGEELVSISSVNVLTTRERAAHRAGVAISVGKAYWNQGVGRRAMETLIDFAKDCGLEVLQLEVRSDNAPAIALYEKVGFEKMGLCKNFMKVHGNSYDAWYMNLSLKDDTVVCPVEEEELDLCLSVIRKAFATVAEEFGLTRENCPTHTSFLPRQALQQAWIEHQIMGCLKQQGKLVGYVALKQDDETVFELKHLAVLPECRRQGFGEKLVQWAENQAIQRGGVLLRASIIEESATLKQWYCKFGFRETETRRFPHLPFLVGYLEKPLK